MQKNSRTAQQTGAITGKIAVPTEAEWLYKTHPWYNFDPGSVEAAPYWSGNPVQRR
jgi:hypothetical protein